MDRKDFYKELMERYTIDEEKVRRTAKRSPSFAARTSRWLPFATAAVVFVTVFAGYNLLASPNYFRGEQTPKTVTLSAGDRLREMESAVILMSDPKNAANTVNICLSFRTPLTASEAKSLLDTVSDTGNIKLLSLYTRQGKEYTPDFNNYEAGYGAKVSAAGSVFADLTDSGAFLEVNLESTIGDKFIPLVSADVQKITEIPVYTPPVIVTDADIPAVTQPPVSVVVPVVDDNVPGLQVAGEDPAAVTEPPETGEAVATETNAVIPFARITQLDLPVEGTTYAKFIGESIILVTTTENVQLFSLNNDDTYSVLGNISAILPKVTYTNNNGVYVIIPTKEFGSVNAPIIADANDSSLRQLDIEGAGIDENVLYAVVSGGRALVKTQSPDGTAKFYTGTQYSVSRNYNIPDGSSILSYSGGKVVFANSNIIYSFDVNSDGSVSEQIAEFEEETVFVRSKGFTNFAALTPNGSTKIYDSTSGTLIDLPNVTAVKWNEQNGKFFSDGTNYYELVGGVGVTAVAQAQSDAASVAANAGKSTVYRVAAVSANSIRIETK
ncbi:MAG: hypothetical protein LBN40_06430 [Oscillospiraceae bacterium]|nr:hypothetical protein [Oscillospiraceae bacterium]